MKKAAKITYESLYTVWKVFSKIVDAIYNVVCAIDKWLMEHEQ